MTVLETERLRLRHLSDADAPLMLELLNDPDFIRNIGDRGVRTLEQARHYILTGPAASYEQHGFGLDLVESRQSGLGVGICGLLRRDSHPDVELGFAFLPAARGQNYAFEAGRAALDFGIRSLGLTRIVALTAPDNMASIRVLEKLGFRLLGPHGPRPYGAALAGVSPLASWRAPSTNGLLAVQGIYFEWRREWDSSAWCRG